MSSVVLLQIIMVGWLTWLVDDADNEEEAWLWSLTAVFVDFQFAACRRTTHAQHAPWPIARSDLCRVCNERGKRKWSHARGDGRDNFNVNVKLSISFYSYLTVTLKKLNFSSNF